jgi:uncharacterized RDD family membrane protein YckC
VQTIEINTAQNVPIVYELAGLRDRVLAFIIDFIVLFGSTLVIQIIAILANLGGEGAWWYFVIVLEVLIFFFYTPTMEILNNGQSVGKMALKIKVVRLDGQEVRMSDFLTRWMFRMVDIYFSLGAIAAMLVSSTEKGQRLGDLLSNTTVVRLQPKLAMTLGDLSKIQTLENYKPKYPAARQIHEDDMLTVKLLLERYNKYPNEAHTQAIHKATKKIADILKLEALPAKKTEFLKTVLKDYVVLTR